MPLAAPSPAAPLAAQKNPLVPSAHGLYGLGQPNPISAAVVLDNTTSATRTITTNRDLVSGGKLFIAVGSRSTTNVSISSISNSASIATGTFEFFTAQNATQFTSANVGVVDLPNTIPAGTTFTITQSGSTGKSETFGFTVDGLVVANVDAQVQANAATGAVSSGNTGTLTQAEEFVFAFLAQSGAGTRVTAPTSGYQKLFEASVSVGASPQMGYGEWKTVAATTAVSSAPTTSDVGSAWGIIVVTYKVQTTVGGGNQTVSPPVATASVSSPTPSIDVQVPPPAGTASVSSPTPTLQLQVPPPAATIAVSSPTPGVQLQIPVPAATIAVSAPIPTITTAALVSPPAATIAVSAPIPTITVTISPPAATLSVSSPVPTPQLRISPAAATISVSSPTPVPQLRISPAVATLSVSSPTPVPQLRISPPAATLTVSGLIPTVSSTGGGGANPPITIRTYLVGASGRTRARSALSATDATGSSGILAVTGSSGLTHATGTSGQTGAT